MLPGVAERELRDASQGRSMVRCQRGGDPALPAQSRVSPEICCIVMSCGNERGLELAVRSILDQDEPVEVVVVNSAGGGARARIERGFPGLPVWETEERLNPGAARNVGLRLTSAPYASFLAADCVAQPGWARARLRRHRAGAVAVASALVNATPGRAAAEASFLLLFRNRMRTATGERLYGLSYERATLEQLGGFREDLRTGEDTELNARLPGAVIEWAPEVLTGHAHQEAPAAMLREHFARGRRMAGTARDLGRSRVRRRVARAALSSGRESAEAAARLDLGRAQRTLALLCVHAGAAAYACGALAVRPELPHERVARYVARVAMPSAGPSLPRRRVRLLAVLPVRDEIDELPACLASLAPHVDGVVALDDGSSDGSGDWLAERPEVLEVIRIPCDRPRWDEVGNRRLLVEAALRHGAEWIVAVDADERLEPRFRARAERVIARGRRLGFDAYSLRLRELWEGADRYRADGVFGRKAVPRLFAARPDHEHDTRELHGYKAPLQTIRRLGCFPRADLELYHRGMVTAGERTARRARYEQLDPDARWQPRFGYAYLTDESGLRLCEVEPDRGWRAWWRAETPGIADIGRLHARRMRRHARLGQARIRRATSRARRARGRVRRAAHRLRRAVLRTAGAIR